MARSNGYVMISARKDPRAMSNGCVFEHVRVAERVLGKPLPKGAIVHHVNGIRDDNRPSNLVICENHQYHMLLHQRQRAKEACGNANWRKCCLCDRYGDPKFMRPIANKSGNPSYRHFECHREQVRAFRAKKKALLNL